MLERPSGPALLEVARRALIDEVAAKLDGRARYVALMVANAIAIAARDIERGARVVDAWAPARSAGSRSGHDDLDTRLRELVAATRSGGHDGDPALYEALVAATAAAVAIWKPSGEGEGVA